MSVDDSRLPQRDGYVNFAEWAGYAWKNELLEQRARVLLHLKEIFEEHGGENWQLVESLNDHPKWIEALEELSNS